MKSPRNLSDNVLLKQYLAGDEAAFVSLMRRYKEPITTYSYRFLGNYDDAVDVAQETFVRLHRFGHTFIGEVKFSTWLYTIASNLARTELKRYRRRFGITFTEMFNVKEVDTAWDIPDESYMPDENVDRKTIVQDVQRALMRVSPTYREMVILRDVNQLSYEEIAAITGTEMGTVKSRISRGRIQLQDLLRDLYIEVFPSAEA